MPKTIAESKNKTKPISTKTKHVRFLKPDMFFKPIKTFNIFITFTKSFESKTIHYEKDLHFNYCNADRRDCERTVGEYKWT